MDNWLESDKSDIEFTEEMKGELDKRLSDYEKNPHNVYSMEDVKLELEGKFGRKLQVKSRS
jgi:putative addiction module component (TIGR02574 family)